MISLCKINFIGNSCFALNVDFGRHNASADDLTLNEKLFRQHVMRACACVCMYICVSGYDSPPQLFDFNVHLSFLPTFFLSFLCSVEFFFLFYAFNFFYVHPKWKCETKISIRLWIWWKRRKSTCKWSISNIGLSATMFLT